MIERISSRANPLMKRVRLLVSEGRARREEGALVAEGIRIVENAIAAGARIDFVVASPRLAVTARGRELAEEARRRNLRLVETTDAVLDSISDAQTSQGVLAVVTFPPPPSLGESVGADPFWVVGWGLQDPGNVGTLVRTADAAGAGLFLTVAGTSDPTAPKAVRASAGSIFRLPWLHGLPPDEILDAAAARGVRLFGTHPSHGVPYDEPDYAGGIGFVFGRESEGLPRAVEERLQGVVSIPMRSGVESLNVGAAAAVVLFEAARRRARRRQT